MKTNVRALFLLGMVFAASVVISCATPETYDLIIRNGTLYDGSDTPPVKGDVAIRGDKLAAVGDLKGARGKTEIDATGLAVAPGFINMLSWAVESLIEDPRSMADIKQGVTLEIFGEGESMGPLTPAMKAEAERLQGDFKYKIEWTTLKEYLDWITKRGVAPNVASFIGATTVREHEIGAIDRPPTGGPPRRTAWRPHPSPSSSPGGAPADPTRGCRSRAG